MNFTIPPIVKTIAPYILCIIIGAFLFNKCNTTVPKSVYRSMEQQADSWHIYFDSALAASTAANKQAIQWKDSVKARDLRIAQQDVKIAEITRRGRERQRKVDSYTKTQADSALAVRYKNMPDSLKSRHIISDLTAGDAVKEELVAKNEKIGQLQSSNEGLRHQVAALTISNNSLKEAIQAAAEERTLNKQQIEMLKKDVKKLKNQKFWGGFGKAVAGVGIGILIGVVAL